MHIDNKVVELYIARLNLENKVMARVKARVQSNACFNSGPGIGGPSEFISTRSQLRAGPDTNTCTLLN